jgi:hypothetical protein
VLLIKRGFRNFPREMRRSSLAAVKAAVCLPREHKKYELGRYIHRTLLRHDYASQSTTPTAGAAGRARDGSPDAGTGGSAQGASRVETAAAHTVPRTASEGQVFTPDEEGAGARMRQSDSYTSSVSSTSGSVGDLPSIRLQRSDSDKNMGSSEQWNTTLQQQVFDVCLLLALIASFLFTLMLPRSVRLVCRVWPSKAIS